MDERNVHPSLNDLISEGNRTKGMEGRFASPSIEEVQHERKMLSVYAAALHCGLCRGLPRSVCRDGARGWYSVFCRRWYLRLVCTKVDADEKEVSRRDGKEGLKRKAASPAGQLPFLYGR